MNTFPATIELACPFPPDRGLRGACTTIADLSRQRGLLYPSKWLAIHTIIRANMERFEAAGKGQKSAHRLRRLRCAMAYEGVPQWEPTAVRGLGQRA